jgi:basic membrane protein A
VKELLSRPLGRVLALVVIALLLLLLPARKKDDATNGGVSPAASTLLTAAGSATARPRVRVGLVFDVGGRGDKSFNDGAYEGLMRARRELDADVQYTEPSGAEDREAALRLFAARGFDLVMGVGFIFSSDVDLVAKSYPNVHFACIDYAPRPPGMPDNVAGLGFREEEGSFLVGAVAGLMTRTKHVGFVGGMTGPLIRKFEAGYEAGIKATCAECTLHAAYAGTTPDAYRDPAKGKALGIAEIAAGADVIYQASGSTGHGVFEAVREGNIRGIGVDADQYDEAPGFVVTSMVKRVDVAVFDAVRSVQQGTFKGGMRILGLAESGIDYVHEGPHGAGIPSDVKFKVDALRADIIAGKIRVPSK